jgi:hypothetical protein
MPRGGVAMMDNKDRREILDKIKKLLAMAADVGSPNEAATAARMAKKLMDKYNVEHAEVLTAAMSHADFERHTHGDAFHHFPKWQSILALAVGRYTDVLVHFAWAQPGVNDSRVLEFKGERSDLEVCKYLYTYLAVTLQRLVKQSPYNHAIGPRTRFLLNAVHVVADRLRTMKAQDDAETATQPNGKAVVLVSKKLAMLNELFGKQTTSNHKFASGGEAARAGAKAGADIQIHRALNESRGAKALEHK